MYNDFKSAIKIKRKELKLSLAKLSELTGIGPSYINRLEKGERTNPSLEICIKLVKTLAIDVAEITNREGIENYISILSDVYEKPQHTIDDITFAKTVHLENEFSKINLNSSTSSKETLDTLLNFIEGKQFGEMTTILEINTLFKLINNYNKSK